MPTKGLTDGQIAAIERLKRLIGIDDRLGQDLSKTANARRSGIMVERMTEDQGKAISERVFNPTIIRIIEEFGKERK